jgi:hypothetical protein
MGDFVVEASEVKKQKNLVQKATRHGYIATV